MPNTETLFKQTAQESSGFLFIKVYNLWHRKIKNSLKPLNITHPQFVVLASCAYLSENNKEVTQTMIANTADMDEMTVSTILKNLEKHEIVTRISAVVDSRAKAIKISEKGLFLLQQAVPIVEAIDTTFFAELGERKPDFLVSLKLLTKAYEV